MRLPRFEYFAPKSLDAALDLLAEKGEGAHLMSGGTDVMVKMSHGLLKPKALIAIQGISELERISFDAEQGLTIGACARLADAASHPDILVHYPALVHAILCMANVEVRNMGTVAGNLCNAAPSADTAPPLMSMKAEVTLRSVEGERQLSLDDFFKGPGLTAKEHGEIMTSIRVPAPPLGSGSSYQRISCRCGVDIAAVGVGVTAFFGEKTCEEARIVLGAVAPVPLRAKQTEDMLCGQEWTHELMAQGGLQASKEAKPISDVRATAEYRKRMVGALTYRALDQARERAGRASR